ncbi:MAG: assimilatory sulfite reductase (NADPH) flavoprotein subunit [Gammaproteobacteria bacterium]|nr:assimilatory sulfite reductase (NADPH) flavoprotein subunit [Gammaproteobacteria bacterium]
MTQSAASRIEPPLSDDDLSRLQSLVGGFSASKLTWASGYLAGLAAAGGSALAAPDAAALAVEAPAARLTILYASQTGNGRRLAEAMQADAQSRGLASRVVSMADYRPAELRKETLLALVVSTHGEGDPPDDAEPLHEYLFGPKAPKLAGLHFTVLALGDSSYAEFCKAGRDFDERLVELGGQRLHARVDCDVDYEASADQWRTATLDEARQRQQAAGAKVVPHLHAVGAASGVAAKAVDAPVIAEVLTNQRITGRGSSKLVSHVEFGVEEGSLAYAPGDALAVTTHNPPALVAEIITQLGLSPDAPLPDGQQLQAALTSRFEITIAARSFVERYAQVADIPALTALLAAERREELNAYLADRQIIDILHEHPASISAEAFVGTLRPLKPRLYSIASSPLATPDEVHLTVAEVAYTAFDRPHWGAASSHLASRLTPGESIEIRVEPNPRFRLPADDAAPVIMIGAGTGVAPYRAFLEHREALGASGRNWLFFGERNFSTDFLYQLDFARFRKRGVLTRMDVAFSRDQREKEYVQHRITEQAAELYAWLEQGAYVYVCGDATHMAPDVHAALIAAVGSAGGLTGEAAEEYLKTLKRQGRYLRDVY